MSEEPFKLFQGLKVLSRLSRFSSTLYKHCMWWVVFAFLLSVIHKWRHRTLADLRRFLHMQAYSAHVCHPFIKISIWNKSHILKSLWIKQRAPSRFLLFHLISFFPPSSDCCFKKVLFVTLSLQWQTRKKILYLAIIQGWKDYKGSQVGPFCDS